MNRSLFYTFKMYVDQVKAGTIYDGIDSCVSISILDFTLFEDVKEYHSKYQLRNVETGKLYTDKIEFHTIELTKLNQVVEEEQRSEIYRWARMFKASTWEEYEQIGEEDEIMSEVVKELEKINQDEEARLRYLHRQMAIMDKEQELKDARSHGLKKGLEQGLEQGRKELVETLRELNHSEEEISQTLMRRFHLTSIEVLQYLE